MNSTDLSKYYTNYYKDITNIEELVKVENLLFNELLSIIYDISDNQYVLTANDDGLKYYEEMFNIIVNPEEDDINFRRARIINRLHNPIPYTEKALRNKLDSLMGKNGYELEINRDEYNVTITLSLGLKNLWEEVKKTLIAILPSNILLTITLKFNSYEKLSTKTYGDLSAYTYLGLREDVLV